MDQSVRDTLKKYEAPGPAAAVGYDSVADTVKGLKGKTIFYIPILSTAPLFATQVDLLKRAAEKAGVTVQGCNGGGNPAGITTCFNQAISAKAAGIISDSIPPELTPQAYTSAMNAKIPVVALNVNEKVPAQFASGVSAFDRQELLQGKISTDQIIADSGGKAKVLLVSLNDSNTSRNTVDNGILPEFKEKCPGCEVYRVDLNNSQFGSIPSLTSTGLVQHPDANYVFAEYDILAQGAVQGIRQQQKTNSVKLVSINGDFGSLQRIDAGTQFADTGADLNYEGWAALDMLYRMVGSMDPKAEDHGVAVPIRTYTKKTIGDIKLNLTDYASGVWFGQPNYEAKFETLWGVA